MSKRCDVAAFSPEAMFCPSFPQFVGSDDCTSVTDAAICASFFRRRPMWFRLSSSSISPSFHSNVTFSLRHKWFNRITQIFQLQSQNWSYFSLHMQPKIIARLAEIWDSQFVAEPFVTKFHCLPPLSLITTQVLSLSLFHLPTLFYFPCPRQAQVLGSLKVKKSHLPSTYEMVSTRNSQI